MNPITKYLDTHLLYGSPGKFLRMVYDGFYFLIWPDDPELCKEVGLNKIWVWKHGWRWGWESQQMYEVLRLGFVWIVWCMPNKEQTTKLRAKRSKFHERRSLKNST